MTPYLITYQMHDGSSRTVEVLAVDAYRAHFTAPRMERGRIVAILPKNNNG